MAIPHSLRLGSRPRSRESVAWTLASLMATAVALGADFGREYKVFTVRKRTGEVLSMKIRLLPTPTTR
jgi:hypothetical protein